MESVYYGLKWGKYEQNTGRDICFPQKDNNMLILPNFSSQLLKKITKIICTCTCIFLLTVFLEKVVLYPYIFLSILLTRISTNETPYENSPTHVK